MPQTYCNCRKIWFGEILSVSKLQDSWTMDENMSSNLMHRLVYKPILLSDHTRLKNRIWYYQSFTSYASSVTYDLHLNWSLTDVTPVNIQLRHHFITFLLLDTLLVTCITSLQYVPEKNRNYCCRYICFHVCISAKVFLSLICNVSFIWYIFA